jgi:hypothetical protein
MSTNVRATSTTSLSVRSLSCGVKATPASGMQYVHRRLQRSVSEMRRYVCCRAKPSTRAGATAAASSLDSLACDERVKEQAIGQD